jgi:outer membrane receptor protein involved in Fe transport
MITKKISQGLIYSFSFASLCATSALAQIDEIIVTAEKRAENIQDVSAAVTALNSDALAAAGIQDITRLENVVPGLRIGSSGGEVRPAMRGARTNEVGVAGTGIAEQVVGIFLDGVYVPTTTAGMGTYLDVERIEVLRGPQGTLYGRNTFAGTINVITNKPVIGEQTNSMKITLGDYARSDAQAVINIPLSDSSALRVAASSEKRDGYVENINVSGTSDDLKEKSQMFVRATYLKEAGDNEFLIRYEYSNKDANSDAIWGYQQLAGYQAGTAIQGHIYGSYTPTAPYTGESPYRVDRNGVSFDEQETNSLTLQGKFAADAMDTKVTLNYSKLSGSQFYDNDYTPAGSDIYGGFGRQDDHETISAEVQFTSNSEGPLSWVGGLYYFDQEADWEWLWRSDTDGDGNPDVINVPGWGNPNEDMHTVKSTAIYGQATYELNDMTRLIGGMRFNDDEKTFTGNIADWEDDATTYKLAFERDIDEDRMFYASLSTGVRTGGANDGRTVSRGAPVNYDNEEVTSMEIGLKSVLMDNTLVLNVAAYSNEYEDVKAQLFALACSDATDTDVAACVAAGTATTFEYYQNGGDSETTGLEIEMQYAPNDRLYITGNLAYTDAEFDGDYTVGNQFINPLFGLGNYQNRLTGNLFNMGGMKPAFSPEISASFSAAYSYDAFGGTLTPAILFNWLDDYYTFDVNLPETLQESHTKTDLRVTWKNDTGLTLEAFVLNVEDEAVLARTVVHSQRVAGTSINSVQANWNPPQTVGFSMGLEF